MGYGSRVRLVFCSLASLCLLACAAEPASRAPDGGAPPDAWLAVEGDAAMTLEREDAGDGAAASETDAATPELVFGDVPEPASRTCSPPRSIARGATVPFELAGQRAWFHDEGHEAGVFHTYDALVACAGAAPRKVHVFLPRDYETSGRRYPVVYAQDGQTAFFTDNPIGKTWDYAGVISELRRCGEIEDVIVVAPHPIDRDREYTHTSWLPGRACCGVPEYTTYLSECLRSFVERNYRVEAGPSRTAIVGSSHGGLSAFWIAMARPDVFGAAGALSPSFWAGLDDRLDGTSSDTPLRESALLAHALPTLRDHARRPRLWIDWGLVREGGLHNSVIEQLATERGREMATLLVREHGYVLASDLRAYEDPDGGHDEDSWRERLPELLRWLFPAR